MHGAAGVLYEPPISNRQGLTMAFFNFIGGCLGLLLCVIGLWVAWSMINPHRPGGIETTPPAIVTPKR